MPLWVPLCDAASMALMLPTSPLLLPFLPPAAPCLWVIWMTVSSSGAVLPACRRYRLPACCCCCCCRPPACLTAAVVAAARLLLIPACRCRGPPASAIAVLLLLLLLLPCCKREHLLLCTMPGCLCHPDHVPAAAAAAGIRRTCSWGSGHLRASLRGLHTCRRTTLSCCCTR
jgi:hypothetical protein